MQRRRINVFNLSFLDVMACGLGAVVLLFMIINHAAEVRSAEVSQNLQSEVTRLEVAVLEGKKNLVELRNSLKQTDEELVATQGLSTRIIREVSTKKSELAQLDKQTLARTEHINALKADLKTVEEDVKRLAGSVAGKEKKEAATRTYIGEGDRQYLTGLKVGGKRILILIDASASMLGEAIVDIIRRRNLPANQQITARKWQRAVATVDWLTTQIPLNSEFQIYTFNDSTQPLIKGSAGKWLAVSGGATLNQAIGNLRRVVPRGGTSLYKAFMVIRELKPLPDNVYLLIDGLPTHGKSKPRKRTVSGDDRFGYFEIAIKQLLPHIPINVILFPIEGDPRAASAYWQLAQLTGGSFISPSKDWP